MKDYKRATVYFDVDVHHALRMKAAADDRSLSGLVNEVVMAALAKGAEDPVPSDRRRSLAQDAEDPAPSDPRRTGRVIPVDVYIRHLRQRGRI
jgi:hypothetical protein